MIFVTPKPGKHIRNPDANYAPLPAAGDTVMDSAYWRMHHRDGAIDLVEIDPHAQAVSSPAPSGMMSL